VAPTTNTVLDTSLRRPTHTRQDTAGREISINRPYSTARAFHVRSLTNIRSSFTSNEVPSACTSWGVTFGIIVRVSRLIDNGAQESHTIVLIYV
jgi:hypothetical protein